MTGLTPNNRWSGERAFVIATGSSLTPADVDAVRGRNFGVDIDTRPQIHD